MAWLTICYGIHIGIFLYGTSKLQFIYPQFTSWFYYEIAFLFGPLLFVHLQSVLRQKTKLHWRDAFHMIPILLLWLGYGDVLLLPGDERRAYIDTHFLDRTMVWNYLLAFQMLAYAIALSWLLVKSWFNSILKFKRYALFLVISYVLATLVIGYLTQFASGWRDFTWYYLVNTFLVFGVGYVLYKDPIFLKQLRKKYFSSSLELSQMMRIKKKIETSFRVDRSYLQNDLSITSFAQQLHEKPHHISQTFSEKIHENFNDYVNKHRIEAAKKMLKNSKFDHFKIEGVAVECGFNNKVTFYKAFTKFAGMTPSKFRKS